MTQPAIILLLADTAPSRYIDIGPLFLKLLQCWSMPKKVAIDFQKFLFVQKSTLIKVEEGKNQIRFPAAGPRFTKYP